MFTLIMLYFIICKLFLLMVKDTLFTFILINAYLILYSLPWNWVNMSLISITLRSLLAANYFKHWFCFYASSICLEVFVYISWLGIFATSNRLSEPFSRLLCCPHFSPVYYQLATDKLCKASINLSVFTILHPFFSSLVYKNMQFFANILYFSANRLFKFLFIFFFF